MTDEPFESHESPVEETPSVKAPSEPSEEQKKEIAKWVVDGIGLSDIQKKINTDFGVVMTYIDVRFLVDDLNLILVDEEEPTPPKTADGEATAQPAA